MASGNTYVDGAKGIHDLSFPFTNNDAVQYLDLGWTTDPIELTMDLNMHRASGTKQAEGEFGLRQPEPTGSFAGVAVGSYVHWYWQANGDVQFWLDDWRGSGGSTTGTRRTLSGLLGTSETVRIRLRIDSDWSRSRSGSLITSSSLRHGTGGIGWH